MGPLSVFLHLFDYFRSVYALPSLYLSYSFSPEKDAFLCLLFQSEISHCEVRHKDTVGRHPFVLVTWVLFDVSAGCGSGAKCKT